MDPLIPVFARRRHESDPTLPGHTIIHPPAQTGMNGARILRTTVAQNRADEARRKTLGSGFLWRDAIELVLSLASLELALNTIASLVK